MGAAERSQGLEDLDREIDGGGLLDGFDRGVEGKALRQRESTSIGRRTRNEREGKTAYEGVSLIRTTLMRTKAIQIFSTKIESAFNIMTPTSGDGEKCFYC